MGATPCSLFPTSDSNDNSVGDVAWSNLSGATDGANADLAAALTGTTYVDLTAANDESHRLKLLFESKVCGEDAVGTWSIPDDATIVGREFICKLNQYGTTGAVSELEAKILKAGSVDGADMGGSNALYNSTRTNYQCSVTTYGGQAEMGGSTLDPATELGAASGFGLALRVIGDGVNNVTAALDTVLAKLFFTTSALSCVIRDNSAETTRQAPWAYHAHAQASRWKNYNPQDCHLVWEMIEFPEGWNPGSLTDPVSGEDVRLTKLYGFNVAWPCDTAGTYKVRCTIYAPDMSESSSAETTFTVAADSRTHRYFDPNAVGSNDGTSAANAWTSAASVVTDANANPSDRWYHLADGQIFKPAGGQSTFTNLSNVVIDCTTEGGTATIQRTTDGGDSMWVFAAPTNVVLRDLDFDGQSTSNVTWGFTIDGAAANFATVNCSGQRCRSWNENSDSATVRRKILHWRPVVADIYRYLMYISATMTDLVVVAPVATATGTNTGEGMFRVMGSPSDPRNMARVALLYPSCPGASSPSANQTAFRFWPTWGVIYHAKTVNHGGLLTFGQNNNSSALHATHTNRFDTMIAVPRSGASGAMIDANLGCPSDIAFVNVAADGGAAAGPSAWGVANTSNNAGCHRITSRHSWHNVKSFAGGDSGIDVSVSGASRKGALGFVSNNSIFLPRSPENTYTSMFIEHALANDGVAESKGNIYGLENGGDTTRSNWRTNNTYYNLTNWNALAIAENEIQVRLPRTAIDIDDLFSLANKSASGTVATGTSTTVFTGDSGLSSEDHYYCGWTIVVGANSAKTVQAYTGSTRTFTLTSALSGTPASPDAITLSRDFATERANGKIAYAAGAQTDIFGRFRDYGETNVVPGPNGLITLPTMSTVTVSAVGDGTAVLAWSAVTDALRYRVWKNLGSISDPAWYLLGETTSLSFPAGGLTNDVEAALGVSVVDDVFNESTIYQIAATPTRGTTATRLYIATSTGKETGTDCANEANIEGAFNGTVATITKTGGTSAYLGGGIDATTIAGTVVAWKLGFKTKYTTLAAGARIGCVVSYDGVAIGTGVGTVTPTSTLAEYEVLLDCANDVANLTAKVAAGLLDGTIAGLGGINGPSVYLITPAGASAVEVDAEWLLPVLAGGGGTAGEGRGSLARRLLLER